MFSMDAELRASEEYPISASLAVQIGGSLCLILGLVLNSIAVVAIVRTPKLHTVTYFLIAYMSIADLILCAFGLPVMITVDSVRGWIFGQTFCLIFPFVNQSVIGIELGALVVMSLHRFILICYPNANRMIFKLQGIIGMISVFLFIDIFTLLPPVVGLWGKLWYEPRKNLCTFIDIGDGYNIFPVAIAFGFPVTAFVISYTNIFIRIKQQQNSMMRHQHNSMMRHQQASQSLNTEQQKGFSSTEVKITKMAVSIVVTYIFCYVPVMILIIIDKDVNYPFWHRFTSIFIWAYGILNICICLYMNQQFRQAYISHIPFYRKLNNRQINAEEHMQNIERVT